MGRIDRLLKIYDQVPRIACQGKCVDSCGPIMMYKLEYERIGEPEFTSLNCPLLVDGRCSQYENRPLICRLWGVVPEMPCPWDCKVEGELIDGSPLMAAVRQISPSIRPTMEKMTRMLAALSDSTEPKAASESS